LSTGQTATAYRGPRSPNRAGKACFSPFAVGLFAVVSVAALAADLLSKQRIFDSILSRPELAERIERIASRSHRQLSPEQMLHHPELQPYLQRRLFPGVRLTLSTNPGVVFGIRLPRLLVGAATVLAFALVVILFGTSDRRAWLLHVAMAMILAGAAGNFYDRLFSEVVVPGGAGVIRHQVRDFIDCSELYYPYIFNLADVFLVAGVAALLLHWWLGRRGETRR